MIPTCQRTNGRKQQSKIVAKKQRTARHSTRRQNAVHARLSALASRRDAVEMDRHACMETRQCRPVRHAELNTHTVTSTRDLTITLTIDRADRPGRCLARDGVIGGPDD